MNKALAIAGLAAFGIGIGLLESIPAIRDGRRERAEISKKEEADVAAIKQAQETVSEMIKEGLYDGKGIAAILNDFNGLTKLYQDK